jgi:RND family efflux transporter MFP subunit
MKKLWIPIVIGLGLVGALVAQARQRAGATTPDPRPIAAASGVRAEGRLTTYPGGEVTVAAEYPGTIVELRVAEKSVVKKGDVIATIRADDERAALAASHARIDEAQADVKFLESEVGRQEQLAKMDGTTPQAVERAGHDRDAARARLSAATAEQKRLAAVVRKTRILAPISGVVVLRNVDAGETVSAGAPLVTIADLSRRRIEAEVDEFDAGRVQTGSHVRISAEGWAGSWRGTVEEIPDAVQPRRLKPNDPGRPSDTRVLLVKVALDEKTPLKLGQRVEVEIQK